MKASVRTACSLLLLGAPRVAGHGYLVEPPARNYIDPSWTWQCGPHCGNGNSVCGDGHQWPEGSDYFARVQEPHRTYVAGSVVQLEVSMNVNHMGHHEFFICDRAISSNDGGAIACLQRWPLLRVPPEEVHSDCVANDPREDCQPIDPNFPGRWYHPPGMSTHRIRYRIPEGLSCTHCTMQWFWPTSNSAPYDRVSYKCYNNLLESKGWKFDFCGWACDYTDCPANYAPGPEARRAPDPSVGSGYEEFRNCADIRVTPSAGGGTVPPPVPATTAAPMPPAVQQQCLPIGDDCSAWCDLVAYRTWCLEQQDACPSPFCQLETVEVVSPAPVPTPTPMPPPMPTPAPVPPAPTPTPPAAGGGCVAAPGKWASDGVSDADCAKCANGYKYWPCSFAGFCEGSACNGGAALAQLPAEHHGMKMRGMQLRRQEHHQGPALIQRKVAVVSTEQVFDEEL